MKSVDILTIVQFETQISYSAMKKRTPLKALFARYVAIVMMHEEGIKKVEIAAWFDLHRTGVNWALRVIDGLLKSNKEFKVMYLACIKRLSDMEDKAA